MTSAMRSASSVKLQPARASPDDDTAEVRDHPSDVHEFESILQVINARNSGDVTAFQRLQIAERLRHPTVRRLEHGVHRNASHVLNHSPHEAGVPRVLEPKEPAHTTE